MNTLCLFPCPVAMIRQKAVSAFSLLALCTLGLSLCARAEEPRFTVF